MIDATIQMARRQDGSAAASDDAPLQVAKISVDAVARRRRWSAVDHTLRMADMAGAGFLDQG